MPTVYVIRTESAWVSIKETEFSSYLRMDSPRRRQFERKWRSRTDPGWRWSTFVSFKDTPTDRRTLSLWLSRTNMEETCSLL